jgi:hypothetical protein
LALSAVTAFASAETNDSNNVLPLHNSESVIGTTDSHQFHGISWICTAHNSHGDGEIYYGLPSYSRHEAQHSAVHECEHHEMHTCVVHECEQNY